MNCFPCSEKNFDAGNENEKLLNLDVIDDGLLARSLCRCGDGS